MKGMSLSRSDGCLAICINISYTIERRSRSAESTTKNIPSTSG